MGTAWELTQALKDQIFKYASFNQTPVSLRQMVQFGPVPSPGSIFLASRFIVEELPIRLAKKVKDLENAPLGLNEMPSTIQVKNWYAQSFQELTELHKPKISDELAKLLSKGASKHSLPEDSITEKPHVKQEIHRIPDSLDDNPAINNIFSDDGIVVRHHHHHHSISRARPRLSDNTQTRVESPTYGMSYFSPCQGNIVWPKEVYDYNKLVRETLEVIKKRHDATVATMAQGVQEWKTKNQTVMVNSQIQTFLDRFYMSRIGIRMLIGQHIALNMAQNSPTKQRLSSLINGSQGTTKKPRSNYVGVICTDCNVGEIAEDAIETAKYICEEYYGLFEAPEIQLIAPQQDINFMYVPGHLIHMLFETLKNSLRATIEFHTPKLKQKMIDEDPNLKFDEIDINDLKFPPIKVIISEGTEDIAIKISDEGGGIPRSSLPLIWTYLYTTVDETPKLEPEYDQTSFKAPMAGFGYGLPISRLYAQYFGGDLKLISMEGYGTDVYLHLNRLSSSNEPLP
ncbi:[pyruvate dehydrogenase [lipoamide]] kinase, mitochondrial precursor, putative [Candida dubliniensis CD36]|uniref:Protein-serine/threonine kinase n=1 Tax=Candida dubliniensis (strain CD36 / ATCC MYA-646 / CBS 7987 / NCPF 3949 / NRRL Y-17841) TaxID=573826 RepID=B9WMR1_CANDC|nr:[pyruvate dehydrogenase [lipoamide]] kinase, mitochondrial precursor, putative [Candida dubliniensis CD36]CAX40377.1 [pyruvate dehydrogenase [lipoamide]] kinase, mitochondrial precursor, putative [Candida dubliniensis CD36]